MFCSLCLFVAFIPIGCSSWRGNCSFAQVQVSSCNTQLLMGVSALWCFSSLAECGGPSASDLQLLPLVYSTFSKGLPLVPVLLCELCFFPWMLRAGKNCGAGGARKPLWVTDMLKICCLWSPGIDILRLFLKAPPDWFFCWHLVLCITFGKCSFLPTSTLVSHDLSVCNTTYLISSSSLDKCEFSAAVLCRLVTFYSSLAVVWICCLRKYANSIFKI